jgi:hypothetical protein
MRGIAKLLFGDDEGSLVDLFGGSDGDGFGMADRARRAGEWCGSTPGHGSAVDAAGRVARPHDMPVRVVIRKARIR